MQMLQINTNLPKEDIKEEFILNLSKVLAKTLGKPEEHCSVQVFPNQLMSFGDTEKKCAYVKLMSIGELGPEENISHVKVIMDELEKLGIPSNRIYIHLKDAQPYEIGYNKTTFAELH